MTGGEAEKIVGGEGEKNDIFKEERKSRKFFFCHRPFCILFVPYLVSVHFFYFLLPPSKKLKKLCIAAKEGVWVQPKKRERAMRIHAHCGERENEEVEEAPWASVGRSVRRRRSHNKRIEGKKRLPHSAASMRARAPSSLPSLAAAASKQKGKVGLPAILYYNGP